MALSFTRDASLSLGRGGRTRKLTLTRITLDNAYAAGGYALTAANLGLRGRIDGVVPGGVPGFVISWNQATKKLQAYKTGAAVSTALAEAANSEAGLNGLIVTVAAFGT